MNANVNKQIKVNQVGYRTKDSKVAYYVGQAESFQIIDADTLLVVYQGNLDRTLDDYVSGSIVSRMTFTELQQTGKFYIRLDDDTVSYPFLIGESVYEEVHRSLFKAFYLFRCGMELDEAYAGPFTHKACHLSDGIVHGEESITKDACGGWHDAGDYGKYVVAGAKAVADLLLAFEYYPQAFTKPLPLPETDELMPDILHECKYEIAWMLKMQDEQTGGVYHKLTTLAFPAVDCMPEDDLASLYFSPISATATGSFAAIMAMAARVYEEYDVEFANHCLFAATSAWNWLEQHQDYPSFHNPSNVKTGEYGDKDDSDERYWAAAELYRTTGESKYHQAFLELAQRMNVDFYSLGWTNVAGYGTITYLVTEHETDVLLDTKLQEGLTKRANLYANVSEQDGFGISLLADQYIWGSNMLVMNHAMIMIIADRLSGTEQYESHILQHIHYTLGANVTGMSFVTGHGSDSIMHPHHRPSEGDEILEPVPGLLSGGPNQGIQDEYAAEHLKGLAPAASFADVVEAYSANEVAIYWNSPAVFVFAHVAATE